MFLCMHGGQERRTSQLTHDKHVYVFLLSEQAIKVDFILYWDLQVFSTDVAKNSKTGLKRNAVMC